MMVAIMVPLAFQFPLNQLMNAQTYQISPHVSQAEAAMAQGARRSHRPDHAGLAGPSAARTDTYWIGNSGNPQTQYIVFDGLDSDYSPAIKNVPAFIASLYPPHTYTNIFSSRDVYVFRLDPLLRLAGDGPLEPGLPRPPSPDRQPQGVRAGSEAHRLAGQPGRVPPGGGTSSRSTQTPPCAA